MLSTKNFQFKLRTEIAVNSHVKKGILKGVRYDLKTHPRVMKILVLTIFGVLSSSVLSRIPRKSRIQDMPHTLKSSTVEALPPPEALLATFLRDRISFNELSLL